MIFQILAAVTLSMMGGANSLFARPFEFFQFILPDAPISVEVGDGSSFGAIQLNKARNQVSIFEDSCVKDSTDKIGFIDALREGKLTKRVTPARLDRDRIYASLPGEKELDRPRWLGEENRGIDKMDSRRASSQIFNIRVNHRTVDSYGRN